MKNKIYRRNGIVKHISDICSTRNRQMRLRFYDALCVLRIFSLKILKNPSSLFRPISIDGHSCSQKSSIFEDRENQGR